MLKMLATDAQRPLAPVYAWINRLIYRGNGCAQLPPLRGVYSGVMMGGYVKGRRYICKQAHFLFP